MIDPKYGWFEIVQYNDKYAATIDYPVKEVCLFIYLRPKIIMYSQGNEFLVHAFIHNLIKIYYGIDPKCATIENPQAKSIYEKVN